MNIFTEVTCTTAKEFLDFLRPSNDIWSSKQWFHNWYFRGQSNANWELKPTVWRTAPNNYIEIITDYLSKKGRGDQVEQAIIESWDAKKKLIDKTGEEWQRTKQAILRVVVELTLISEFVNLADYHGNRVPDLVRFRELPRSIILDYVNELNTPEISKYWTNGGIALAQHHGVPTRLLDWTKNPLKAAYFAAVNTSVKYDKLAVYAIHMTGFHMNNIKLIEPTFAENSFLRVQEGIFTLRENGDEYFIQTGMYPSIESSYRKFLPGREPHKFSLPVSEASELLRMLYLEGVTKAHLMPTLDSVTDTLKVKWESISK